MIYTVIAEASQLCKKEVPAPEISLNGHNLPNSQNRDCRYERQPLSLIPQEVREYIEQTKNERIKAERLCAYTTLFLSLNHFFGIENCRLERTSQGKPYIVLPDDSVGDISSGEYRNIFISLSHSDGVTAVCLSDEGDVGVDLQSEIDPERAERLKKRFFTDVKISDAELGVKYFLCSYSDESSSFMEIQLPKSEQKDFTDLWAYCESVIKLYGKGFDNFEKNEKKLKKTRSEAKKIDFFEKKYVICVSSQK